MRLSEVRKDARAQRPGTVRWPKAHRLKSGRWQARFIHNREFFCKTFRTKREADEYIRRIKNGDE
jgi:hypothetical protein